MKHEIRIRPDLFCRIKDGSKTFVVEGTDRAIQPRDRVVLREYDPTPTNTSGVAVIGYTGEEHEAEVGFVEILDRSSIAFSIFPVKKVKSRSK